MKIKTKSKKTGILSEHVLYACTFMCLFAFSFVLMQAPAPAYACNIDDRACIINEMLASATTIDKQSWREQTLREIAKTKAFDGDVDGAITLIDKIENPDTKAMTIRGIGMAVADSGLGRTDRDKTFQKLHIEAKKIEHPPSHAIALTYIAMAQAFADDDEGAWLTAQGMENSALRNKAYGETAEIQAEKGNYDAAMKSIGYIDTLSFRDKAYSTVSKILADHNHLQSALNAAGKIENSYKKATALQYVLDVQKPREVEKL